MKYRAVAVGVVVDGHPVQSFGHTLAPLEKWAQTISEHHSCEVKIFVWEERLIGTVAPQAALENPCNYNHETLRATTELDMCPQCKTVLLRKRGV